MGDWEEHPGRGRSRDQAPGQERSVPVRNYEQERAAEAGGEEAELREEEVVALSRTAWILKS